MKITHDATKYKMVMKGKRKKEQKFSKSFNWKNTHLSSLLEKVHFFVKTETFSHIFEVLLFLKENS